MSEFLQFLGILFIVAAVLVVLLLACMFVEFLRTMRNDIDTLKRVRGDNERIGVDTSRRIDRLAQDIEKLKNQEAK